MSKDNKESEQRFTAHSDNDRSLPNDKPPSPPPKKRPSQQSQQSFKVDDKKEKQVEFTEARAQKVLREIAKHVKDDDGLADCWDDLAGNAEVVRNGKKVSMEQIAKTIKSACEIKQDINLQELRIMESKLGRVMCEISLELTLAATARDTINERKKDYLAEAKDRRKSQAVIESELVKINPEFKMIRNIALSTELTYKFWRAMHEMVSITFDRLKQISISLAAEARVDRFMNQDVLSIGTEQKKNKI